MCISQMILVIFVKGDHSALCARADFTMHNSERKIFEIVSGVFLFKTCRKDPRWIKVIRGHPKSLDIDRSNEFIYYKIELS